MDNQWTLEIEMLMNEREELKEENEKYIQFGLKDNQTICDLRAVLKECDDYLDSCYKMNSIGTGSILHNKIKAVLEATP